MPNKKQLKNALVNEFSSFDFDTNNGYIDDEDEKKLERMQNAQARSWLKLYKRIDDARIEGNQEKLDQALEAMRKHEEKDLIIKEKLRGTEYYWY